MDHDYCVYTDVEERIGAARMPSYRLRNASMCSELCGCKDCIAAPRRRAVARITGRAAAAGKAVHQAVDSMHAHLHSGMLSLKGVPHACSVHLHKGMQDMHASLQHGLKDVHASLHRGQLAAADSACMFLVGYRWQELSKVTVTDDLIVYDGAVEKVGSDKESFEQQLQQITAASRYKRH
jgi:hypothetical protein